MSLSRSETGASRVYRAVGKGAGSTHAPLSTTRGADGSCSPHELREKMREAQHRGAVVEALLRLRVLNTSEVLRVMRSSGTRMWPVPGLEDPSQWDWPAAELQVSCWPVTPTPPRSTHPPSPNSTLSAPRGETLPPMTLLLLEGGRCSRASHGLA